MEDLLKTPIQTKEDLLKMPTTETEETSSPVTPPVVIASNDTIQSGIQKAMEKTIADGKEIKDLAKDLTYLKGASDLQSNDDFTTVYQQELGKQMVKDLQDEGKRQAVVNAARKQEAKNIRNTAYFQGCKPIFDLLGIEAAFGMIPMIITTVLLMVPFLAVSLIRFIVNSINSIFVSIAKFSKPAMWICGTLVCIVITGAVVFGILALFNVKVF